MKIFGTDYDGVIINIEPQKASAFGELLYREWGVDKDEASRLWMEKGGTSRRYKFDHFYENHSGKKLADETYEVIESEYSNLLKSKYYSQVKLLDGALELLKFARTNFNFTFISSGIPTEEIKYLANLNGVSHNFDLILGTGGRNSSKADHFRQIIQERKPNLTIFVADSPADMKIAKEFGAIPIGVLTNHSREELLNAGASVTCDLNNVISVIKNYIKLRR